MSKNKISEWSAVAANNTDVGNIDIAEGCAPSGINNAIREMMAQIKDMQSGANNDDLTIAGTLALTGGLTLDGSAGTSGQVMLSAGSGNTPTWGNAFVAGMIMLWSGSIATVPSGWLLCDGSNGTPNLRDRFVVGAGSTYTVAATGGSADATLVAHTHTGTVDSNGAHTHLIGQVNSTGIYDAAGGNGPNVSSPGNLSTNSAGTHTHTFTTNSSGSSGTNANLPPYYALAYIMKA